MSQRIAPPMPDEIMFAATQREIGRRTTRSIFQADGRLDEQTARGMVASGQGDISLGEYLHLTGVQWAPDPDGSEHCIWLSRLVEYMAQLPEKFGGVGPFSTHDQKVLHAVAMLYCTGRQTFSWCQDDPTLKWEEQSARKAEVFFQNGGGDGTYWARDEVRKDVCNLIYRHRNPQDIASDKRLQVFADAVRFETARYWPNTEEGLNILRERVNPDLFHLGWAKDKANFRGWMIARGWK